MATRQRIGSWRVILAMWGTVILHGADPMPPPWPGDGWREARRIVDLHQHIAAAEPQMRRAVGILDRSGIGVAVNLSGGTVTAAAGQPSAFERWRDLAEATAPGRFVAYFNLDYTGWDDPGFPEQAIRQVETAHRLGAAGLKEFKRLGLYLRDGAGELIRIDDPRLDGVWRRCGELGMPVSIHVADPRAFWLPYNAQNERWAELKDHPKWWFGDPAQFPPREALLAALSRVIERHPGTTFVAVHFANNAEDLDWVERELVRLPNLNADLAARIPELGRHDPVRLRRLFTTHADRILFASDFQVYDRLILGSAGDAERPTDDEGVAFFLKEWRWLETEDRDWPHMTPIQGDWTISSIGLPPRVLRKIYFDNARRLLARSMPPAVLEARHILRDFSPDGRLDEPEWRNTPAFPLEQESRDGRARPELSTEVRFLWSDRHLYVGYECPFTELTDFGPPVPGERIRSPEALWDRDVVELFVAPSLEHPRHYTEYEWAPNNEALDLQIRDSKPDFDWSSGMEWAVTVHPERRVWICEARIPLASLHGDAPVEGTRWRANVYRIDRANRAFLASNPTLSGTFHTPARFGWLVFRR
ncbi:MAG: amidohydrolase family protein [Verrucomicrobiae bacterium]|nr:amidohydrolase family protein [Verrucomicrobiae bacterium]